MKRFTSLLLAFALAFGLTGAALASDVAATRAQVRDYLEEVGCKVDWLGRGGDEGMAWSSTITRAEVAQLIARAEGLTINGENPFTDVKPGVWYYNAIVACATNEAPIGGVMYFIGHGDGTFGPENDITLAEVKILVERFVSPSKGGDISIPANSYEAQIKKFAADVYASYTYYEYVDGELVSALVEVKDNFLRKSVEVPANVELAVIGELEIPAGMTLTISKKASVTGGSILNKGTIVIKEQGILTAAVNNKGTIDTYVELASTYDGTVILEKGGKYRGVGLAFLVIKSGKVIFNEDDSIITIDGKVEFDTINLAWKEVVVTKTSELTIVGPFTLLTPDITVKGTMTFDGVEEVIAAVENGALYVVRGAAIKYKNAGKNITINTNKLKTDIPALIEKSTDPAATYLIGAEVGKLAAWPLGYKIIFKSTGEGLVGPGVI